jgi:hypothetical protein
VSVILVFVGFWFAVGAPAAAALPDGYAYLQTVFGRPVLPKVCDPISYTLDPEGLPDGGAAIVEQAIDQVAYLTGLTFVPASEDTTGFTINIAFHEPTLDSRLQGQAIGVTQTRIGGTPISAYIAEANIALDTNWYDRAIRRAPTLAITATVHELGHAIGLGHTAIEDSIMNPWIGATEPTTADRQAFAALSVGCQARFR